MSVSKSKNLERKLDNFAKEAKNELNNVCGTSLWESLGFVFFAEHPDLWTGVGAAVIFVSNYFIVRREAIFKPIDHTKTTPPI